MRLPQIAEVVVDAPGFGPVGHRPNVAGQNQKTDEAANGLQILHSLGLDTAIKPAFPRHRSPIAETLPEFRGHPSANGGLRQ
jgi:hypothetical protein